MINKNNKIKYTFYNVEYPILNGNIDLSSLVNKFITENTKYFKEYISVILQVRNADDTYYTIGDRFPINLTNKNEISDYIDYLTNKWTMLDSSQYDPKQVISVLLNFANTDQDDYIFRLNKIKLSDYKSNLDFTNDAPLGLPLNTEYLNWGSLSEFVSSNVSKVSNLSIDSKKAISRFIEVTFSDKINRSIKVFSTVSGIGLGRFTDKIINQLKDEFIRQVGDKSYHIKFNKLFFIFEKLFSKEFITTLKPHKKFNLDIMTLDVETYLDDNNKMLIYCISFFDGDTYKSFYISDYKNIGYLIKDLLSTILSKKYSNKIIYIHNSSEFDLIFLLKYIVSYGSTKVNPIIKDGKFINLTISYGKDNEGKYQYELTIRDSLLLLLSSLSKLGKAFNVDMYIPKGPLYPKGDEITVSKIKLLDIPKLIIQKGIDFIKNMFKTVKHYDINSLYPSAMLNYKYPTDIIGYFIGDITLIDNYSFLYNENLGIYKVKVNAPDIKHPLLPIRNKNTCLYPKGTWTGWYFSEEIKNCEKYGYLFEILGGYVFKSEYIFTDYIKALNAIKVASEKGSPMYLIAKILMNSLYGRFGLNPFLNTHSFIPNIDFNNFMIQYRGKVVDCVDFGSHHLVSYLPDNNPDNTGIPANVAIALAITSYSRIIMSQFKNRDNITLFYSDTDSLVIDCYLPKEFVDSLWV